MMNISVIGKQGTLVTQLASKIIRDWAQKIENQLKQQSSSIKLPPYSVSLVSSKDFNDHNKEKFNLIVVLDKLQLSSAQMLALSGQLSTFGQKQQQFVPAYVTQLAIANSTAVVILQHYMQFLRQKNRDKVGHRAKEETKVHRLDCVDCLKYFGAFNVSSKAFGMMGNKRGSNILDGGAPYYAIYPTKQGLLAIGNLQPKFYQQMVQQMGLSEEDKQYCLENQINFDSWPKMRTIFANKLLQKTALQWQNIMKSRDTCVTAVKDFERLDEHFLHPFLIRPRL